MHILAYKALLFLVSFSIPPPRPGLDQVDRSNRNLLQACDGQGCAWVYARARLWVREAHNPCVRVGEGESTEKQYIPPLLPRPEVGAAWTTASRNGQVPPTTSLSRRRLGAECRRQDRGPSKEEEKKQEKKKPSYGV